MNIPKDKERLLELFTNKAKERYSDTIDAVVVYGSYITGTEHEHSDLDVYFIPNDPTANRMSVQFIYDEVGYDFWPIEWETLESIVSLKGDFVSLIGEGELYYSRNETVEERFYALKMQAKMLNQEDLDSSIERHLKSAKAKYFDMYEEKVDLTSEILSHLIYSVAYMNKRYIVKSISDLKNEAINFSVMPLDFVKRIERIASKSHMVNHNELQKLIVDTSKVIQKEPYGVVNLNGFYEEIKSSYNKVYHGCEVEDYLKVYFTLASICHEIKDVLGETYHAYPFPNLAAEIRKRDFKSIADMTRIHEQTFKFVLQEMNVDTKEIKNVENLVEILDL